MRTIAKTRQRELDGETMLLGEIAASLHEVAGLRRQN
jgi:hypothetical protein